MSEIYECSSENAAKILNWLRTRGGISIWKSVNLANPGGSWTSPRKNEEGEIYNKPNWQCGNEPQVKIRMGRQGMSLKLTDGSSARLRRAVEQADNAELEAGREPSAFYRFGAGDSNEARCINGLTAGEDVASIYVNDGPTIPILEWEARQNATAGADPFPANEGKTP